MITSHLKIAGKVLLRRKFFTFVSLFGTAFTLVVLMVVAAMFDEVISPAAPEVNLDRTLFISRMALRGPESEWTGSPGYGFLDKYCRNLPGVETMSLYSEAGTSIGFVNGEKVSSALRHTDGEYWIINDFRFVEGRPYTPNDVEQAANVAVISQETRRKFFGDAPAIGGRLETGGRSYEVIGIVRNVSRTRFAAQGDIWVPLTTLGTDNYRTQLMGNFHAALLTRSASSFPAIRAEFLRRLPGVEMKDPKNYDRMEGMPQSRFEEFAVEATGTDGPNGRARTGIFMLCAAAAALLFMLLPAINLINLNISRILERSSEIGVRKAFGATSLDLVGQFLLENVVLTLTGGLIGLLASTWVLDIINRSGVIPHSHFHVNARVFVVAIALSILFGAISGVYPAWRMSRLDPVDALQGGAR